MSPTRLFVLDAFERGGDMHPYQLRSQAEQERLTKWTDISTTAVYGTVKRLEREGLLAIVRTERDGGRPERQVLAITEAGRRALAEQRQQGLVEVADYHDPFDLALTRIDAEQAEHLPAAIEVRIKRLERQLEERRAFSAAANQYLTPAERFALTHRVDMLEADIAWHRRLLAAAPDLGTDSTTIPS